MGCLAHTKLLHNVQWEPLPGSLPACDYEISIEITTRWLVQPINNNNNTITINNNITVRYQWLSKAYYYFTLGT